MFELPTAPAEDGWLTLYDARQTAAGPRPAVRLKLAPVSPSAQRAAIGALAEPGHPLEEYAADSGFDAYSRELCRRSIIGWEGVGQAGAPAPLTAANIDALLTDPDVLARLQGLYVFPFLDGQAEKNALPPSSAGTSPATMAAKATARAAHSGAKPAPTSSTPRKRAKAKPAGR